MANICLKCKEIIPFRLIIDNKERVLNKRKYCLICSPFGSKNRINLTLYNKEGDINCEDCGKLYFYSRESRCGASRTRCSRCWGKKKRLERKILIVEMLGGSCKNCGYSKCLAALHVHHKDPSTKKFSISGSYRLGKKRLLEEVKKCELLCSNCHAEEHNPNEMR